MLCGECKYTDGLEYLSDPVKVKCTITEEFHNKDDECNCEFSRLLYDKRATMTDKGANAINTLEALRDRIENGFKTVDVKRVYNTLLEVVNEGIVSDKLNEVIAYLEEFIND
jgi:hypothetical protein